MYHWPSDLIYVGHDECDIRILMGSLHRQIAYLYNNVHAYTAQGDTIIIIIFNTANSMCHILPERDLRILPNSAWSSLGDGSSTFPMYAGTFGWVRTLVTRQAHYLHDVMHTPTTCFYHADLVPKLITTAMLRKTYQQLNSPSDTAWLCSVSSEADTGTDKIVAHNISFAHAHAHLVN